MCQVDCVVVVSECNSKCQRVVRFVRFPVVVGKVGLVIGDIRSCPPPAETGRLVVFLAVQTWLHALAIQAARLIIRNSSSSSQCDCTQRI